MQHRSGHVVIESIAAESAKFAASLVFIHGLWCTAAVWRPLMGFFAHRGWTSYALQLRGHAPTSTRDALRGVHFADYLSDVHEVLAACETPAVLVGHDLGGVLALASASAACAVVALAPLTPASSRSPLLSSWRVRLALARSRPVPPPRGAIGAAYFNGAPPGGTTLEASGVARQLQRGEITTPAASRVPALVLAGAGDVFAPASEAAQLAAQVGASFRCVDGARHALPWEPGWEQRGAEIHRWLIQTLGDGLLLLREEDET